MAIEESVVGEKEVDRRERFLKRVFAPRLAVLVAQWGGRLERTGELLVARRDGAFAESFIWVVEFPAKIYILWKGEKGQWEGCHCVMEKDDLLASLEVLGEPGLFIFPPTGFTEKGEPVVLQPLYLSRGELERLSALVRLDEWL